MFDTLKTTYHNIISSISIIGFEEEEILKHKEKVNIECNLSCLFCIPNSEKNSMNQLIFDMMFPDRTNIKGYYIDIPKFFSLTLTNEYGTHSYLYCLKFPEKYQIDDKNFVNVPIVISIKSNKEDYEPFRKLLNIIHEIIICDTIKKSHNINQISNFKKVELLNLFCFCFSIIKPAPHTNIQMTIKSECLQNISKLNFYFSSNCEIPCNSNDKDINMLFSSLDINIILKLIISLLMEKQIILRASQAHLLHVLMPATLKLIFPFKYIHSYIPVLPYGNIELLDKPGSYFFGVLSDSIKFEEMMEEYPGRVVIDCDTNEIFNDNSYEPYIIKENSGLEQGKNIIFLDGSSLFKYDDKNKKKIMMKWEEKDYLVFDCQNSQFVIDTDVNLIEREDYNWLRRNIQLVKNPEIFNTENVTKDKDSFMNMLIMNSKGEIPISPKRSFSYNIQNIFLEFFEMLISFENKNFFKCFKQTNLYMNYIEQKEFQNDSGKKIVENIKKTKKNPRTYNNSFVINYSMKIFPVSDILDEIKNDNSKNQIKKILKDYLLLYTNDDENNFNFDNRNTVMNMNIFPKKDEIKKNHVKNCTSVLQQTSTNESLFTNDETPLLFYKKEGFFSFLKEMSKIILKDKKDFNNFLYVSNINQEIKDLLKFNKFIEFENIFGINSSGKNIIVEDFEEELDEINYDKNKEKKIINEKKKEEDEKTIENIIPPNDENSILSFMLYNNDVKESIKNIEEKDLKINHELQYYLFLAFNLEEIKNENNFKQVFFEGLSIPKDKTQNIYLNDLIIKLYKLAYKCEDKKEFPYIKFYFYLKNLEITELEKIKFEEEYLDLKKIFNIIYEDKKKTRQSVNLPNVKTIDEIGEIDENYFLTRSITSKPKFVKELEGINFDLFNQKEILKYENEKMIINENELEFQSYGTPNLTDFTQILPLIIQSSLPSIDDLENKSLEKIIEETNLKMQNQALIEIIARLKDFNPKNIESINDSIVFWVNIFNSLLIFTIFYKKYDSLNSEKDWKLFLKNIHFYIGNKTYSFNDIQMILFGKTILPADKYKPEKYVNKLSIEQLRKKERKSKNEIEKNDYYISYFCLYLPTPQFLPLTIFNSDNLKSSMEKKDRMYLSQFVKISNKILTVSKFLLYVEPSFTNENTIKKYELTIDGDVYESIIDKSYSKIIKNGNEDDWKLNFSNINEEIFAIRNINSNPKK